MKKPLPHFACSGVACLLVIFVACGAGAEVFQKHTRTFLVGPNPSAIVAADINGDGLPEIVTANTGGISNPRQERPANDELSFLLPSGPLDYVAQPPLRTGFAPYALAIGTLAPNKAPDILAVNFLNTTVRYHDHDLTLFRNVGQNLYEREYFRVPSEALAYNRMRDSEQEPVFTKPGLTSFVLADVNQDGLKDVVATGWCSDVLVYFPGAPNTWFGDPKITAAPGGPRDIKASDFDGDGKLDLVVVLYSSNEIGLWKGDGTGTFLPVNRFSSRGKLPTKVQAADINGDGKSDLVVGTSYTDDAVEIFYGEGNFRFPSSQEINLGVDAGVLEREIRDVAVGHFAGSGRMDIAAACYGSGDVAVLINKSAGPDLPQEFATETYAFEGGKPRALYPYDFNKDGAMDLAVALWDANAVGFLLGIPKPEPPKDTKAGKSAAEDDKKKNRKR
jgi:hypothetical protein